MNTTTDCNGRRVSIGIRRDPDGTWSRNVWSGSVNVTDVRRYYGYRTREAARNGDISESPQDTNRRVCGS